MDRGASCPGWRRAAALAASLISVAIADAASAQVLLLSNTPVTYGEVLASFAANGPGLVAITDGNALGIHVNTRVWQGTAGTDAEGLFLYDFWLEATEPAFRTFTVPVASRSDFDLDGDAMQDTSAYCSDCTSSPVPTPPTSAFQGADGVTWSFESGLQNFSTNLYLVSDRPPAITQARIQIEGVGSGELQVLPEPGAASAAAAAFLGIGACRSRRSRRRR